MLIATTAGIAGQRIVTTLGLVLGPAVRTRGLGGNIMAGLVARTVASGDGLQTVALVITNDQATYLISRPRELPAGGP